MAANNPRERLVRYVQELERLQQKKDEIAAEMSDVFSAAKMQGFDTATLRVVLKLRKLTPDQRRERRALESIYMAALGMLDGDALTDEARRRLGGAPPSGPPAEKVEKKKSDAPAPAQGALPKDEPPPPSGPAQPPLVLKEPAEARQEGAEAAAAGKRIYDNPYPAGDPCRAAWDEGWCSQNKSHGMETPAAFQRRSEKPPKPPKKDADGGEPPSSVPDGKSAGAGDDVRKGAA